MREYKFRGMDLHGHWFVGNLSILPKDLNLSGNKAGHYISNSAGAPFAYAVRPETVGQYTELKDKADKELYYEDIINVYYGHRLAGTEAITTLDELVSLIRRMDESGAYFMVAGNIHEHSNLLRS